MDKIAFHREVIRKQAATNKGSPSAYDPSALRALYDSLEDISVLDEKGIEPILKATRRERRISPSMQKLLYPAPISQRQAISLIKALKKKRPEALRYIKYGLTPDSSYESFSGALDGRPLRGAKSARKDGLVISVPDEAVILHETGHALANDKSDHRFRDAPASSRAANWISDALGKAIPVLSMGSAAGAGISAASKLSLKRKAPLTLSLLAVPASAKLLSEGIRYKREGEADREARQLYDNESGRQKYNEARNFAKNTYQKGMACSSVKIMGQTALQAGIAAGTISLGKKLLHKNAMEKQAASFSARRSKQYWQLLKRLHGGTEKAVQAIKETGDAGIYHGTKAESVADIIRTGLKPGRTNHYGKGVYFGTKEVAGGYGDGQLLRLKKPSELSGKEAYPPPTSAIRRDVYTPARKLDKDVRKYIYYGEDNETKSAVRNAAKSQAIKDGYRTKFNGLPYDVDETDVQTPRFSQFVYQQDSISPSLISSNE